MSWRDEVDELNRRRRIARTQGGKEGIAKQHARGRLTIRERIDGLLDPGSFQEHGKATAIPEYDEEDKLTGFVPANYVVGFGKYEPKWDSQRPWVSFPHYIYKNPVFDKQRYRRLSSNVNSGFGHFQNHAGVKEKPRIAPEFAQRVVCL